MELVAGSPPAVRYLAEWATVRCLIFSGHLDLVEGPLAHFEALVGDLDSINASGGIAELRGHWAVANGDWKDAAEWFSETAESQSVEHPNWYRLAVTWHALTANAIAGNKISGHDLGDPWRWFRSESIMALAWHGAVASAIALDRLGHRDLAERLIWWARRADPGGVMPRFERRTLVAAGLDVAPSEQVEDLDALIDEVIAVADALVRHAERENVLTGDAIADR